jgi:hypothetical protein
MLSFVNIHTFIRDTSIKDLFVNFLKISVCIITISLVITILEKISKMSGPRIQMGANALTINNSKAFEDGGFDSANISQVILNEFATPEYDDSVVSEQMNRFMEIEEKAPFAPSEMLSDTDELELVPPTSDDIEPQISTVIDRSTAKYKYSRNIFPLGPRSNYYSKPQDGYWVRMGQELDNKSNTFIDLRDFDQGIPKASCLQVSDGAEYAKFSNIMNALKAFIAKRPMLSAKTGIKKLKVEFNVSPFGTLEILNTEFISNPTSNCPQSIEFNDQETFALVKFTTLRAFQDLLFDYRLGRGVEYGGQSEGLFAERMYSYDSDKYKRERQKYIPEKVSESVSFTPELLEQQLDNLTVVGQQTVAATQELVVQDLIEQ